MEEERGLWDDEVTGDSRKATPGARTRNPAFSS